MKIYDNDKGLDDAGPTQDQSHQGFTLQGSDLGMAREQRQTSALEWNLCRHRETLVLSLGQSWHARTVICFCARPTPGKNADALGLGMATSVRSCPGAFWQVTLASSSWAAKPVAVADAGGFARALGPADPMGAGYTGKSPTFLLVIN